MHMFILHDRGVMRLTNTVLRTMVSDFAECGFDAYYKWEGILTEHQIRLTEEEKRVENFFNSFKRMSKMRLTLPVSVI